MLIALSMVGLTFVLQHTPLDITSTPPSSVTLPITFAETDVIDVTSFEMEAIAASISKVNIICSF